MFGTRSMYALAILAIVLNMIDILTTVIGLNMGYLEGNTTMDSLIQNSMFLFFSVKIAINLAAVSAFTVFFHKYKLKTVRTMIIITMIALIIGYLVIITNNILVLLLGAM